MNDWLWARRIFLANLVCQIGIIVTGGLVRVTGSGLGCPTWPQCVPGSYTPVVHQEQGYHKNIEFGNRLLTFVVVAVALAMLVVAARVAWRHQVDRRRWLFWGAVPFLGVVAQALLGGVTVLTGLSPIFVAAHFLLSTVLVAASTWALLALTPQQRATSELPPGDLGAAPVARELRWLTLAIAALAGVVLVLGTVVTGSGPHSGDATEPVRFGFDPRAVSWLHADAVLVFIGLVIAVLIGLRFSAAPALAQRRARQLLAVTAAQGLIGYVQYATGLPIVAVVLHMFGAALLTVAVTALVHAVLRPTAGAGQATLTTADQNLTGVRR